MSSTARPFQLITVAALVFSATRAAFVYPRLPNVVASHFGAAGVPDAFSSKEQFFLIFFGTVVFTVGSLLLSVLLMHRIPPRYLNLPHKEYWLDDNRLPEARRRMAAAMWSFSAATMVLCAFVLELVIAANLEQRNLSGPAIWIALGCYTVFTLVWVVKLLVSFTPKDG